MSVKTLLPRCDGDHDKYGSCRGPRRRARAQFCILRSQFCAIPPSAPRHKHPLQVERAVGLIDGIIQEDACMNFHFPSFVWNAMSSGWMIRNVIKMETYYQKQCAQ